MPNQIPRLALTVGEPAGIGPDLTVQLAQQVHDCQIVAICDPDVLFERAKALNVPLKMKEFTGSQNHIAAKGELWVKPIKATESVVPGQLNPANAQYVLDTLTLATQGCLDNHFDAIVTAPVHKGVINQAGIPFTGHTEFLEQYTKTDKVVMMLATQGLMVALATTHLPLKDVPSAITQPLLKSVIQVLHRDLKRFFGLVDPHILVCGLNPHAGEGGHMGREEIEVMQPALNQLRQQGLSLSEPLPADTLFTPKVLDGGDVVLAMYHDQGLPVLKFKGFGRAANITLGLPIIRTSVDHGTALDLAGSGKADGGSLQTAIDYAIRMAKSIS